MSLLSQLDPSDLASSSLGRTLCEASSVGLTYYSISSSSYECSSICLTKSSNPSSLLLFCKLYESPWFTRSSSYSGSRTSSIGIISSKMRCSLCVFMILGLIILIATKSLPPLFHKCKSHGHDLNDFPISYPH